MQYTIDFNDTIVPDDNGYVDVAIVESVQCNEALGDQIGITTDGNRMWFGETIDADDRDIKDFIRDNFKDYQAVMSLIRRVTS